MKSMFLTVIAAIFATAGFGQDKKEGSTNPPAAAEAAFTKGFPGASKVKWGKEEGDYEVEFSKDGKKMSAVYTPSGQLQETEEKIDKSELPATITSYIKQHYKQGIRGAEKTVDNKGRTSYEVEVGETELVFDGNGKLIKANKEEGEKKK